MLQPGAVDVVLFDLDGTLVDSAPDLAGAVNDMRLDRGMPAMPFAALRPMVGSGARGMIGAAFGLAPDAAQYEALRDEFLAHYASRLLQQTDVFPAVRPVLAALDLAAIRWGVVTNKAQRFAEPLMAGLGLLSRSAVLVCGDTTPFSKPHPAPLIEAAQRVGVHPSRCVYVGDDQRDVDAGRAAGMATIAAAWGYLGRAAAVEAWGADVVIRAPAELLQRLEALNSSKIPAGTDLASTWVQSRRGACRAPVRS